MANRHRHLRAAATGLLLLVARAAYPVFVFCPRPLTQGTDPGTCGAVVTYATPRVMDGVLRGCLPASGTVFAKGDTTVRCLAIGTEPFTVSATCEFTATVEDTEPPVATCPVSVDVPLAPGQCSTAAVYPSLDPPTDNCAVVPSTVQFDPPAGTVIPVGTTTVTLTAKDAAGNAGTCQFPLVLRFPDAGGCDADRCTDDGCSEAGLCSPTERPPTAPDGVLCNVDNLRARLTAQPEPACVAKCFAKLDHRLTTLSTLLGGLGNLSPKKCRHQLDTVLRDAKTLSKTLRHLAATGKLDPPGRADLVKAEAAAVIARATTLAGSLFCTAH